MAEITTTTTTSATVPATKKPAPGLAHHTRPGLTFSRFFTTAGVSPYDELEWELRTAQITDSQGGIIFEQQNVEVPKDWSMTATNIVASKYLHGPLGTPERESGVRALVTRVAETIRDWGIAGGYFRTAEDAAIFHDELTHLLLQQKAAFNSPVWFNVGCDRIEPNSDARNWHWNPQAQRVEWVSPAIARRSVRPASSTQCTILSTRSSLSPRPKVCCSSGDQWHRQLICRRSAPPRMKTLSGRRHRFRSAQLHARFRRICRRDQIGRQNEAGGQDGNSQHRPS